MASTVAALPTGVSVLPSLGRFLSRAETGTGGGRIPGTCLRIGNKVLWRVHRTPFYTTAHPVSEALYTLSHRAHVEMLSCIVCAASGLQG